MSSTQRDQSLDILKGFSCLAMVIAHLPFIFFTPSTDLGLVNYFSTMIPPTLFFAVAGVTAAIQISRYTLSSLLWYFFAMFLLGFSWNITIHGDISAYYWPEIFQIIAIGSMLICVLERNGTLAQWKLLLITGAILCAKPLLDILAPDFDGWNYLLCDHNYQPEIGREKGEQGILPGFPLLPWTAFFVLGVWCYRAARLQKLLLAIVMTALTIVSALGGHDPVEKWDSSISYITACCTLISITFWLLHGGMTVSGRVTAIMHNIGSNTFLFFFVHPAGIIAGAIAFMLASYAYPAWLLAIVLSVFLYNRALRLKPSKRFESLTSWYVVVALLLLLPLTTIIIEHEIMPVITRLIAIIIGIICAVNFSSLAKLIKVKKIHEKETVSNVLETV